MGCPKKFSISNGFGAALMADPARGGRIVRAVHEAVNGSGAVAARGGRLVPVSVKTRLCGSVEETVTMLRAVLTAAGHTAARPVVHAVTLHARERDHRPEEAPLYERAAAVVRACRTDELLQPLCFVLNGSVATRGDGVAKMARYGFDSAMLARAALVDMRAFAAAAPQAATAASMEELVRELFTLAVQYRCAFKNFKYHLTRLFPAVDCLKDRMPVIQSQLRCYADGYTLFHVDGAQRRMLEECAYEVEMLDALPEAELGEEESKAKRIRSE
ncbi:tRNA-dihydrouridine synthase 2 [Strigomonas culicis]|uniref:tRNA-dihydrouridine synthase 2 n=1 Tax=Strigomonas culicis TaxID=28005 RepID=S9W8K5_9TRYP|nr:tRNA-dihydrouridine synthase 2 [Strigomonas culicis]|eukprot:EPY32140.1 tRNA-dihydrouridine synthase 2 [Strigomonas culicis]